MEGIKALDERKAMSRKYNPRVMETPENVKTQYGTRDMTQLALNVGHSGFISQKELEAYSCL